MRKWEVLKSVCRRFLGKVLMVRFCMFLVLNFNFLIWITFPCEITADASSWYIFDLNFGDHNAINNPYCSALKHRRCKNTNSTFQTPKLRGDRQGISIVFKFLLAVFLNSKIDSQAKREDGYPPTVVLHELKRFNGHPLQHPQLGLWSTLCFWASALVRLRCAKGLDWGWKKLLDLN